MSLYCSVGSPETALSAAQLQDLLAQALSQLGTRRKVLAVPPDQTRLHSRAGDLTAYTYQYYGESLSAVLPALGTHNAMSSAQLTRMFPGMPHSLFHVHDWRNDIVTLGEVPSDFIHRQSEGKLNYAWPAQVNRLIANGGFDLILSIGQVVPHEVIGMANYTKNILIGTGGREGINRSHYLGAVYGLERIMGRAENPVRAVLNYASDIFLKDLPIVYVLTVVGREDDGALAVRGLFIGDDAECFHRASELSLKVNFQLVEEPLRKVVVYLEPHEFHSTWLGNKAVYRTRMALDDGAELIILAPAVCEFGEDKNIDSLIRRFGYRGTPATLAAVEANPELAAELSAAAHLIQASSEGRFTITWCPGHLTKEEVEGVGYQYGELNTMLRRYNPDSLSHGFNTVDGEEIYYIANPGLGLWAHKSRL
ncbi:MAG TPA: lactate racemase domain-containing protein [Terracidiphilus sp.]|jgi:nickel-dependent lactate racemase|nr:lactate racemase domain-containing protein [Terracidiphilus sp.]